MDPGLRLGGATRRQGSVLCAAYWEWCRLRAVSEQEDVIGDLESAGMLAGIRWAFVSACARTMADYDEADGHDAAWFGTTRHTFFRNRLDRVFSCKQYALREDGEQSSSDLVLERLSQEDIDTLPHLDPRLVVRNGLRGSPGWVLDGRRFLLASTAYGEIARLPWPHKSPVKQEVAAQRSPEPPQSLFDDFEDDEIGSLRVLAQYDGLIDLPTFVVAHSLDAVTGQRELVFGRPKLNVGGGPAWHWRENLLREMPASGGARTGQGPLPYGPDAEPDAPVTLRTAKRRTSDGAAGVGQ
jgi:hypothetical protein